MRCYVVWKRGTVHLKLTPVRPRALKISVRGVLLAESIHGGVHVHKHNGIVIVYGPMRIVFVLDPVAVNIKFVCIKSLAER